MRDRDDLSVKYFISENGVGVGIEQPFGTTSRLSEYIGNTVPELKVEQVT